MTYCDVLWRYRQPAWPWFREKTDVNLLVLGRSNRPGGMKTRMLGTVPMVSAVSASLHAHIG